MDVLLIRETFPAVLPYQEAKQEIHMSLNHPHGSGSQEIEESKPRVLYLDDDQGNLDSFRANFRDSFQVYTATNPVQAYNMIESEGIQIAIADHHMPSMSGVEFLESLSRDFPQVQRILLTGYTETIPVVEAINKGRVFGVLTKPFNIRDISAMVRDAWQQFSDLLDKERTIRQLIRQNQQFEFILRQRLLS
jgi:DNA-binding NtrC family response regulator